MTRSRSGSKPVVSRSRATYSMGWRRFYRAVAANPITARLMSVWGENGTQAPVFCHKRCLDSASNDRYVGPPLGLRVAIQARTYRNALFLASRLPLGVLYFVVF